MSDRVPVLAVGAVVLRSEALLMIRRGRQPWKGLWSIPGGRVERGEYLAEALRREVREETGIAIEVRELAGILEVIGDPHYVILDYIAVPLDDSPVVAAYDATEVKWVPLDEVATLECTPRFVETMKAWGVLAR